MAEIDFGLVVETITAVAVCVTAYVMVMNRYGQKRRDAADLPIVSATGRPDGASLPTLVEFHVNPPHERTWRIVSVTAWPIWRPSIARREEEKRDACGAIIYEAPPWSRRLLFGADELPSTLLLRSDGPEWVTLRFAMAQRADPRSKSRFDARIRSRA